MNPKSHPLAACVILGLAALIGSVLLMSEYLGEWPFVVLLSLGLAGSVIAYIDGDFRMLKAGPSGVELERYATQAI
ncbi:MAG: hypothetical protein KDA32_15490, partial [Phycisphaerales bacterium]|nr:hypothetical protein [Phycisphaerales bacterium]